MTKHTGASAPTQRIEPKRAQCNPDGSIKIHTYGRGLELWVSASGLKTWRTKTPLRAGPRIRVTLGTFPEMSLTGAHSACQRVKDAPNPAREIRSEKAQVMAERTPLREVAARAIEARSIKAEWTERVLTATNARIERYILPALGNRAIADVTMDDIEAIVRAVHRKRPRTAIFVKQHLSLICGYAVRRKLIEFDPVKQIAEDLPSHRRGNEKPRPYVATIDDARAVLAAIDARAPLISPWTLLALRLIALTAVRSNEALGARWSEIDFDKAIWIIPAERMKGKAGNKREHVVALAPQAIEVLKVAAALRKSKNEYVFPSHRHRGSMGTSTLSATLRKALAAAGLGNVIVPHGWRSTFMTITNEIDDGASFRVVDVMLAHTTFRDHAEERDARKGGAERHYNHAQYLPARHRIACQWADMLLPPGSPTALEVLSRGDIVHHGNLHHGDKFASDARQALRTIDAPAPNVVPMRRRVAA